MPPEPTLDLEKALADIGDDQEIYEDILKVYLDDTPQILVKIKNAFRGQRVPELIRLAHSLKSSSRSIGGLALGMVAAELEAVYENSAADTIPQLIENLHTEFDKLKKELSAKGYPHNTANG
ncbi:MAG: Hpt domain-containing protein [Chitinivibrionales bacterium]|nr:Hpt domain-containing protein [Chitinivibrionales bacterium]